jgi:hypothetical protein
MSTQQHKFTRRTRLGMTSGFMLRRKVLAVIAALLMGASLVFSGSASAHNIDVKKAREVIREYARSVRDQSGGKYIHFSTRCGAMFPNHNHYARCTVEYQNAKDSAAGVYTCKETIEVFMRPNGGPGRRGPDIYDIYAKHTSFACGGRKFNEHKVG